jgi:hypothetical protein
MRKKSGTYIIPEESSASTPERLDGEYFSLLHLVSIVVLDEGNLFAAMDMVSKNIMARNISDRFHRYDLSVNLNFVAFHHFLDRGANVTHSCVNAGVLSMYQLHNPQFKIRTFK